MNDFKPWYLSNSVWASICQILTGVAVSAHVISISQAAIINADAPLLIMGALATVWGGWGLWGRLRATTQITLTEADADALNAEAAK